MNAATENLKTELDEILKHYSIPFEDRTLILEKIDGTVDSMIAEEHGRFDAELQKVHTDISSERESIRHELDGIRASAMESVGDINGKIEAAYAEGLSDGVDMTAKGRPNTFQAILGLGLIALAMVVVVRTLLGKD